MDTMVALLAQTQSGVNPSLLLAAPIFGLLGTALGWWLNQRTERRRHEWQLADEDRRWKREERANQYRWTRDQRKESYAGFTRAVNEIHQQALRLNIDWGLTHTTQLADELTPAFSSLMYTLRAEFAAVQLVGNVEVGDIAWQAVIAVMEEVSDYQDKDKFEEANKNVNSLLDRFVNEAKVSLEVGDRQSE